jgi:WD40 repeat protein
MAASTKYCNWLQVNRVVYHPTEDTVITGSHDTTVRIWNVPTAQTIQVLGIKQR